MKKVGIFIVIALIGIGAFIALKNPKAHQGADAAVSSEATSSTKRSSTPDAANSAEQTREEKTRAHAQSLADRAYKQDPVAIEQIVDLNGTCRVANGVKPGTKIDHDMARVQEYCRAISSLQGSQVDWSSSMTSKLDKLVKETRASRGEKAVGDELDRVLETEDPYAVRAVLQYSARNDVLPDELKLHMDSAIFGTPAQREQLEILSQLEFCRRGGDCGSDDFSTLTACIVIGPCKPGEGLIAVFRRKSTPDDFDAAIRLSQFLASN